MKKDDNNKKEDGYYLGLDIGDGSCGYAVTDKEYNICRHNGKPMSGVLLFEQAQTAQKRRVKRTSRRRIARRRERIALLQDIFSAEIIKCDPNFFRRLEESSRWTEDKFADAGNYTLFCDENFGDKEFYKKYPTIYHLRRDLMENGTDDPRLLYLACHHIIKYRGHFLSENQEFSAKGQIKDLFFALNTRLSAHLTDDDTAQFPVAANINDLADIFKNAKNATECEKATAEFFGVDKKDVVLKELIKAFCGNSFSVAKIFGEDYKEFKSIKFDSQYEQKEAELKERLGDKFEIIESVKYISDSRILNKLLGAEEFLSVAKVKSYEEHHDDLKILKDIYRKHLSTRYKPMFKSSAGDETNYCAYAGINKRNGIKLPVQKCGAENFLSTLTKELTTPRVAEILQTNEKYKNVLEKIKAGTFLPKQATTDNSVFPYQIHLQELDEILKKSAEKLPFLSEKDADATAPEEYKTATQKIKALFKFRIPYYVGPLNPYHKNNGGNAWVVRTGAGKVTPWNFDKMVDTEKSAEGFINNLIGKCTYLKDKCVLPKQSLLYAKYDTLNQLNTVSINGKRIDEKVKKAVYDGLFCREKTVSKNKFKKFLKAEGFFAPNDTIEITGIDGENFVCGQSALIIFKRIFGDKFECLKDATERIIYLHCVYTKDKKRLEKIFTREFHELFCENFGEEDSKRIITELKGLSFTDFGKFSSEFLEEFKAVDKSTGEVVSVIDAMYEYPLNLQEIVNSERFTFKDELEKYKEENRLDKIDYAYVNDLYLSPAVKRAVWQANCVVDEIVKIMGAVPKKIFIEVTRENDPDKKGKRTSSREKMLHSLYEDAKRNGYALADMLKELNEKEISSADLREKRLYLYFLQLGKCAYSGETIHLENLSGELYDIDHIIPQSVLKDDSIKNNLVLVLKKYNQTVKKDFYPVPEAIRNNPENTENWKLWRQAGLISEEKYRRLTRNYELTDDEKKEFINRQLVSTAQAVKEVAEMFKIKYDGKSKIVYSKAGNVSDFRQDFSLLKSREANNLHHANDAYLNIVVGNVYDSLFSNYHGGGSNPNKLDRIFKHTERPGIWEAGGGKTIAVVKRNLAEKYLPVSKKVTEESGALYDETIYKKTENDEKLIPIKESGPFSDTTRYGGFKSQKIAYFVILESDGKKGARTVSVEGMPVRFAARYKKETLKEYFEKEAGLKNVKILHPKLRISSLLQIGTSRMRLRGKTGDSLILTNANEWFCSDFASGYIRTLVKYKKLSKEKVLKEIEDDKDITVSGGKRSTAFETISKTDNIKLYDEMTAQLKKKIYADIPNVKNQSAWLCKRREKFSELAVSEQAKVLLEVLNLLKCSVETSDLTALGGVKNAGKITIGKKLVRDIYVIEQSVTGLYEKKAPIKVVKR